MLQVNITLLEITFRTERDHEIHLTLLQRIYESPKYPKQ
jgi:hypothetical protein